LSKTVGKYVKNQDVKINTICSVVRQNTYAIDKQNQYSRRENIRITGLPENDDVDDFDNNRADSVNFHIPVFDIFTNSS
jgi:hypothetical protein